MKAKEKAEAKTRKAQEVKRAKEKAKQAADKLKAKLAATKAKAKAAKAKAKQAAACKAPAKKKRADDAQGGDAQPPRRLFEGGLYSHGEEFLGRLRRQLDRAAQAAEFDEADEAGGGVGGEVIETDEAVWHDEWRQRLGCWWLALPMQTRSQLGSCFGALSLHLSARFDALLGRRLPPSLRTTPPRGGGGRDPTRVRMARAAVRTARRFSRPRTARVSRAPGTRLFAAAPPEAAPHAGGTCSHPTNPPDVTPQLIRYKIHHPIRSRSILTSRTCRTCSASARRGGRRERRRRARACIALRSAPPPAALHSWCLPRGYGGGGVLERARVGGGGG